MVLLVIFNYFNNSFHVNMFIFYYNFRIYWNDMLLNIYNISVEFVKVKILENVNMLESILFLFVLYHYEDNLNITFFFIYMYLCM